MPTGLQEKEGFEISLARDLQLISSPLNQSGRTARGHLRSELLFYVHIFNSVANISTIRKKQNRNLRPIVKIIIINLFSSYLSFFSHIQELVTLQGRERSVRCRRGRQAPLILCTKKSQEEKSQQGRQKSGPLQLKV